MEICLLMYKKKEQPPNRSDRDIFNIFKHLFLHKYITFHAQVTTLKKNTTIFFSLIFENYILLLPLGQ